MESEMDTGKMNHLDGLPPGMSWTVLVSAAKRALTEAGYELEREPGRGLSNQWKIRKGGKSQRAAIRTTRDRWFAFQPSEKGTKWKTLDEVEVVVVAAVDSKDSPQNIQVYQFPAKEARKHFVEAYEARVKEYGSGQKDNFGFWIGLDKDDRGLPTSVGTGLANLYPAIATYPIKALLTDSDSYPEVLVDDAGASPESLTTIAEVMAWTRDRVAKLAGVAVNAVRLELKVDY